MKKILWIIVLSALMTVNYGQRSIDDLFEKYAGDNGFVTVTLKGNLLNFFRCEKENGEKNHLPRNITEIRLLIQEDKEIKTENFYNLVMKDIKIKDYEEFMRVKESDQDLRMLVRTDGDVIREFLLIGGGEDNLLIQIKGRITFNEADRICSEAKRDHGSKILSDLN